MKFFTRAFLSGELSDEQVDVVFESYRQHIEGIAHLLPVPVLALAKGISLHDALIRQVTVHKDKRLLSLFLRCGDSPRGYYDVDIIYSGIDLTKLHLVELAEIAHNSRSELQYSEVDLADDNSFEHRMIFFPKGEIAIRFATLNLNIQSQPDRLFQKKSDRYREE